MSDVITLGAEGVSVKSISEMRVRKAVRAVIQDSTGYIAVIYSKVKDYYSLPGGAVEKGESIGDALHREVLEEVGCEVSVLDGLGQIDEIRIEYHGVNRSYGFLVKLVGEKGAPQYSKDEIVEGLEVKWMSINDAIEMISSSAVGLSGSNLNFFKRELLFIEKAQKMF